MNVCGPHACVFTNWLNQSSTKGTCTGRVSPHPCSAMFTQANHCARYNSHWSQSGRVYKTGTVAVDGPTSATLEVRATDYHNLNNNKTDVECRETFGCLRTINPDMINHFAKQSPLLFYTMYVVCMRSNQDFVLVASPMSRLRELSKSDVSHCFGYLLIFMVRSHLQHCLSI